MQCHASTHRWARRRRLRLGAAFTLVEMMVVVGIAAVLLGIGWNVATHTTRTYGVTAAGRTLATQLRLTRQYAIGQHAYVALLLPSATDLTGDDVTRYGNVALRACVVTKEAGGTYRFSKWPDESRWQFLPNGVKILADNTTVDANGAVGGAGVYPYPTTPATISNTNLYTASNTCTVPVGTQFPANTTLGTAVNVRCVVFKSTGQLDQGVSVCIPVARTGDSGRNIVQVVVNWVTGRATYYHGDGTEM